MSRISDTIKQDHREIESYYKGILSTQDSDEQTRYQNMFTWELARHSVGEELVVYPAMEKYLRDGSEATEKDRQEHQKVKEQLKKFQDMYCTDSQFIPTIRILMSVLSNHISDEETVDLVKLEEAITPEESDRLARSFSRTKMFVPSRSHPSAPNKPPYETAVGLMTAPLDHLADLFRKWPDEALTPNPSME
ncbi:hypothetical protein PHISP_03829 [Aspergillus sp. HF37]|nr:hypothetical protein PHISP_03829 [Aspergillus sp. HF37]